MMQAITLKKIENKGGRMEHQKIKKNIKGKKLLDCSYCHL
jgi:hypothetical protein